MNKKWTLLLFFFSMGLFYWKIQAEHFSSKNYRNLIEVETHPYEKKDWPTTQLLFKTQKIKSWRSPASVSGNKKNFYSIRQLYFQAIYAQYYDFQTLLEGPTFVPLKGCPHYHDLSLMMSKEFIEEKKRNYPISSDEYNGRYTLQLLKDELKELCSQGNSLDYYLFENLVSMLEGKDQKEVREHFIKSPIFTNRSLYLSIIGKKEFRPNAYEQLILERLGL